MSRLLACDVPLQGLADDLGQNLTELKAEVKRLNGEIDRSIDAVDSLEREIGRLKAEIKRLHAATPLTEQDAADLFHATLKKIRGAS